MWGLDDFFFLSTLLRLLAAAMRITLFFQMNKHLRWMKAVIFLASNSLSQFVSDVMRHFMCQSTNSHTVIRPTELGMKLVCIPFDKNRYLMSNKFLFVNFFSNLISLMAAWVSIPTTMTSHFYSYIFIFYSWKTMMTIIRPVAYGLNEWAGPMEWGSTKFARIVLWLLYWCLCFYARIHMKIHFLFCKLIDCK